VARDALYEEIMAKAWNPETKFFGQSYEDTDVLDSAVLIMPLVFFMHAVGVFFCSVWGRFLIDGNWGKISRILGSRRR
jgi:hypothetical protein